MPIDNFDFTPEQAKDIQTGFQNWQAQHNSPTSSPTATANPAVTPPAPSSNVSYPTTPAVGSGVGTTSTPFSSALGVSSPTPQSNPATPQMQQISSQWKANPSNDPAIAASNNALHEQNLKIASQIGLTYDPNTGQYSHAPTQQDGALHLSVNGQSQSDVPVFKGASFESGADLAKQLGLDYKADPKTGEITIGGAKVMPTGYDKNGNAVVGVRAVANALGYQIGYDDNSKTVTVTGKAPATPSVTPISTTTTTTQPTQTMQQGYNSPIQSIGQGMPQMQPMTPWTPPDVSGFQKNMLPYQTFNPNIDNYYKQAHNQLDPQFNANNQKLMDKQNMDIKQSDESMNRRGIFSSGVAQSVENDLRAKTTNAIAAGFTSQMAQIEKTAQTLFNTAYKQFQDGNQFALKNNQDQVTNMLNVEKQSFSEWAQTQKLDQAQYGYALKAWDQMAGMIMKDAQNQMNDNHFNQTMDFNQYKFDHPSAAQQLPYQYETANNAANNATSTANNAANNQSRENIALLPYKSMTVYQQATTDEKAKMDDAANYFKQKGIDINYDKLFESIRHNTSTESLTANAQTETNRHNVATEKNAAANTQMNAYKLAGYLPNGQPTFDREKFKQAKDHDASMVEIARTNAVNGENKTQIDAIGKELSSINSQINAIYGSYTTDPKQQTANTAMVTSLNGERDKYISQLKSYTDKGFINPPGQ